MKKKLIALSLCMLMILPFLHAAITLKSPDASSFTGTYQLTGGSYTDLASNDTSYLYFGETRNNQKIDGFIQVTFDLTSLGFSNKSSVQNITLLAIYCHDGSNGAPGACTSDAAEGTVQGTQNVDVYNYSSASWINLGNLSTADSGDETFGQWNLTYILRDFIESGTDNFLVRFQMNYTAGTSQDDWLVLDYAALNITYDNSAPNTTVNNVSGDTAPTFYDSVNDSVTNMTLDGEAGMLCRWSTSDTNYSLMSSGQECSVAGAQAVCSPSPAQGAPDFYVSCKDSVGNEQNTSQNLDITSLIVDWTAPSTNDSSSSSVQLQGYSVNLTESDNVDNDPATVYCTDTLNSCAPSTAIDNGSAVNFSERGIYYLRYNSTDDAGNTLNVSRTITINRLPVLTSASDDTGTVKGGTTIAITTVSSDSDSGQSMKLFVCNSSSVSASGCSSGHYCNGTGTSNLSCSFTSETDTQSHVWYAFLYDALNETAASSSSGSYVTDSTAPSITITSPANTTYTQNAITFAFVSNEVLTNGLYSLNGAANISLSNVSLYEYTAANSSVPNGNYSVIFYANDSYGNSGNSTSLLFQVDTTAGDTTSPSITVLSPQNNTYSTSAAVFLNMSADESLFWAGYKINSSALINLSNVSLTIWNSNVTFGEGTHNLTFYANDSSSNRNSANKTLMIAVDVTDPAIISFSCNSSINDSIDVLCTVNSSDAVALNHSILEYNATGTFQNSSFLAMNGTSGNLSYSILAGNTTPVSFLARVYVYDRSGRANRTSVNITVIDDSYPGIYNITYSPNTTDLLDPNATLTINASILENYNISRVMLMYRDISVSTWTVQGMSNTSLTAYNSSLTLQNGTWQIAVNATDMQGNQNISSITNITVENDTSFFNSTTIPATKSFTLSEAASNKTLGTVFLNNTGDTILNFSLSVSPSVSSRVNINNSGNQTHSYSASSGQSVNVTFFANTSSLPVGLYPYNFTISSEAGTTVYQRYLNIQPSSGAYLSVTIDTYSASVSKGQTGVELSALLENLGTEDASNVFLNWTLPSEFTLTSGSSSREIGDLPIGASARNTITVSVSGSAADSYVNITSLATGTGNLSGNDTKQISIGNPVTITQTVSNGGSSGGGGGGSSAGTERLTIARTIEIVRGKEDSFIIAVKNTHKNETLENIHLLLSGYLEQYISISPQSIDRIMPLASGEFRITLKIPSYKSYEEYLLNATITGEIVSFDRTARQGYIEEQYLKLIVREVSQETIFSNLETAREAVLHMKKLGFNAYNAEQLFKEAEKKSSLHEYESLLPLLDEILALEQKSLEANQKIGAVIAALQNPLESALFAVSESSLSEKKFSLSPLLTGHAVFSSDSVQEIVTLAAAAFERGEYVLALERAEQAALLLQLERKGNFSLFLYLYWQLIVFGMILMSACALVAHHQYQRSALTKNIENLNKKEDTLRILLAGNQKQYFLGKKSKEEYAHEIEQHQHELGEVKRKRLQYRNERRRYLKPQEIVQEIDIEMMQVTHEIQKIQTAYYQDRKISEQEYKIQFRLLHEQLAELEEERMMLSLHESTKHTPRLLGEAVHP